MLIGQLQARAHSGRYAAHWPAARRTRDLLSILCNYTTGQISLPKPIMLRKAILSTTNRLRMCIIMLMLPGHLKTHIL